MSVAITVGAVFEDPRTTRNENLAVVTSEHAYTGVVLNAHYYAEGFGPDGSNLTLKAPDGPVFGSLEGAETVGIISAAIRELGAASTLSGPTATEKAARKSYKSSIGAIL